MSEVRVRFAPSPTGYLHVGGARTAIYNYLFAKATNGKFILRIEDTDRKRYNEEALHDLIADLKWLGLNWDEGIEQGGEFGPYQQSERLDLYAAAAKELIEKGQAYYCFCTAERLDQLRSEQKAAKKDFGYDRHCRDVSITEAEKRIADGEKYVIRLKVPDGGITQFNDLLRGKIEYKNKVLDDLVLLKRDGFPTYHLASVVDDHAMKISHVLRGDEWIASTPKHVLLYQAFGWEMPIFCHLPVILAAGGGKLSKRKGATSVGEYQAMGYLPETMVNFLALLGWSPGDDREVMSLNEMIDAFTLERINSSGVAFDEKKLLWMNGQHLAQIADDQLYDLLLPLYKNAEIDVDDLDKKYVLQTIQLLKPRAKLLDDVVSGGMYFFKAPESYDPKSTKKAFKIDNLPLIKRLSEDLNNISWTHNDLEKYFNDLSAELEKGLGQLMLPIRLAVCGVGNGPGFFELLELIGQKKVISRINVAINYIESQD